MKWLLLATISAMFVTQAVAKDAQYSCLFRYDPDLSGTPGFADFPAKMSKVKAATPRLRSFDARYFRTAIRQGSATGVNFAGHFTIVGWGCGSNSLDWAVVNRLNGSIYFDPAFRIVATEHVGNEDAGETVVNRTFDALRFRRDSALLVVQGAPGEDADREGVAFLRWTGQKFIKLAFVPAQEACRR